MMQNTLKNTFDYNDGNLLWKNINPKCRVRKNGDIAGSIHHTNRREICLDGKKYQAQRLIWIYHNGDIPNGYEIDHINRNPLDNRIENLRLATPSQNCQNQIKQNKHNLRGIYFHKKSNKYAARITTNGKRILLGYFDTASEASAEYISATKRLFGQYAAK